MDSIRALPLSELPLKTRSLLSHLLNSRKVIYCPGPIRVPRDWRGLASFADISNELLSYIQEQPDKTGTLLTIWQQKNSPTIGDLLDNLCKIDRYDVHDDVAELLLEAASSGLLRSSSASSRPNNVVDTYISHNRSDEDSSLTDYDRPGQASIFDAVVLFHEKDREFALEMIDRMTKLGFKFCTVNDLQAGHTTQYKPMAQVISRRCLRVILVFSPDFLNSCEMDFYTDFAQATSIESSHQKLRPRVLPVVYRKCELPLHMKHYLTIYYGSEMYDFWNKLHSSLQSARFQIMQPPTMHHEYTQGSLPSVIVQEPQEPIVATPSDSFAEDAHLFIDDTPPRSVSQNGLDILIRIYAVPEGHTTKKKNPLSKIFNPFKRKKRKALMFLDRVRKLKRTSSVW
ncbi:myeloid differentiation primary response protein MyD88-like isoform X1 [Anticarsia gemmatalis]|uniref:myeloid differentiation primary response protein MyD88-like isoform X1 n=1 Tax=Anticarsia gemmatalis TaxID=129554 RepID=UPI003F76F79D